MWQQRQHSHKQNRQIKNGGKGKAAYFPLIPARCMTPMPSPSWAPPHFLVKRWPCALLPLHVPLEPEEMGDFRARQGLQGPAWGRLLPSFSSQVHNIYYPEVSS